MISSYENSLPFHEPSLPATLTFASFLLLLPASSHVFDHVAYAGIIAYIVLGAVYCVPLGNILPLAFQESLAPLGYLGLLLLIVGGGLETRLSILGQLRTFLLAMLVGLVGIGLPIGVSMGLCIAGFGYSPLQGFVVGAALSSTSLGTIFAVLESLKTASPKASADSSEISSRVDLLKTRVGTVLVGAALLDDIVALVLSSIVATLGDSAKSSNSPTMLQIAPWDAARPVVVSILLILVTLILSRFVCRPAVNAGLARAIASFLIRAARALGLQPFVLGLATIAFVATIGAFTAIATYIGSSPLIGAFCAGATMQYVWSCVEDDFADPTVDLDSFSPSRAFASIAPVQHYILVPFFFASVGAAIPVKDLFTRQTVWRGIIFSVLMFLCKMAAGAVLPLADLLSQLWGRALITAKRGLSRSDQAAKVNSSRTESSGERSPEPAMVHASSAASIEETNVEMLVEARPSPSASLWSALLLGLSLVARGEIGFLIINIARESGVVGGDAGSSREAFDIAIWAIVLNTLVGPIAVGLLLKRTRIMSGIASSHWS